MISRIKEKNVLTGSIKNILAKVFKETTIKGIDFIWMIKTLNRVERIFLICLLIRKLKLPATKNLIISKINDFKFINDLILKLQSI